MSDSVVVHLRSPPIVVGGMRASGPGEFRASLVGAADGDGAAPIAPSCGDRLFHHPAAPAGGPPRFVQIHPGTSGVGSDVKGL